MLLIAAVVSTSILWNPGPGTPTEIPLEHHAGHYTLEIRLNGQGPYRFLLDTGASGFGRIDDDLAEDLKLELAGTVVNRDGTGGQEERSLVRTKIALGTGESTEAELLVADYAWVTTVAGGVDGIVGFELLALSPFTIDFKRSVLIVGVAPLDKDADDVFEFQLGGGCPVFPLAIGDQSGVGLFDTGSDAMLNMPGDFLGMLRFVGEPQPAGEARTSQNSFPISACELADSVFVGPNEFRGVRANFSGAWQYPLIGGSMLEGCTVTVDSRAGLARIVRSDP